MSLNTKQKVRCSSCGQMHDITVWNSITVNDSADLKQELLRGNINMFKCPDCGFRAVMNVPMLYDDADKKMMISFYPSDDKSVSMKLFEQMKESFKESEEIDKYEGYNLRFVSDYNSLLEKILIADNGLWDKAIEVLKLLILSQEPEKEAQRSCIFGKLEDEQIEFMVKDSKENQIYISRVPLKSYKEVETELRHSGVKPYSFNWEYVDIDYAAALLNGVNNIF